MLFLSIILIFLYVFICKHIKDPLLRKIITFFAILYGCQISMAIWDPYHIFSVSVFSIILFNIQIICFIIGANSCKRTNKNVHLTSFRWPIIRIDKIMLVAITIFFIYSYYNYNRMQTYLLTMANTSDEGRAFYFTFFFPTYTMRIIDMFLTSFKYVAFFASITLLFSKGIRLKLKEWYFVILSFSTYVLLLLTSQSRTESFVILFILVFMTYVSSIYDTQRYKKYVLPFVSFAFLGVAIIFLSITLLRSNLSMSGDNFDMTFVDHFIFDPFATYFYVPILAFDYSKDTLLNFGFPLFGLATFSSIVDTLLLPLTFIDKSFGSLSMNTLIGSSIGLGHNFPSGKHWMAMYTGCANYYMDFWYLGFIIFPVLHGWVMAKLVYSFRRSAAAFILLAFMFYTSFRHATASGIQSVDTVFFLFWVYLTVRNKSIYYNK